MREDLDRLIVMFPQQIERWPLIHFNLKQQTVKFSI